MAAVLKELQPEDISKTRLNLRGKYFLENLVWKSSQHDTEKVKWKK